MTPESAVLHEITDYLTLRGVWWMRISKPRAGKRMKCAEVGCADLLCTPNGKMLWVEVKSKTGQQSTAQKEFQWTVERHGHQYTVARGAEDLDPFLGIPQMEIVVL